MPPETKAAPAPAQKTLGIYKPRTGLKVVGTELKFRAGVPAEGAEIPDTPFWRRRIADGDLIKVDPPKTTK